MTDPAAKLVKSLHHLANPDNLQRARAPNVPSRAVQ
jgi:hypothetical protein